MMEEQEDIKRANQLRNYWVLRRILVITSILFLMISVLVKTQPGKNILFALGAVALVSYFVQMILFRIRPDMFNDKNKG